MKQRLRLERRKQWWAATSVLLATALGGALWLAYTGQQSTPQLDSADSTPTREIVEEPTPTAVSYTSMDEDVGKTLTFTAMMDSTSYHNACSVTFSVYVKHPPSPSVIAVSDGSHDSLLLEWTGGPKNATKWQYRSRMWRDGTPLAWGTWIDIPNSDADTRSHRVTSLLARQGYEFQVRPVVGTTNGDASEPAEGGTQYADGRKPSLLRDLIAEGDGRTEWRLGFLNWVFVIPDDMRLQAGGAWRLHDGFIERENGDIIVVAGVIQIYDLNSGSYLLLSVDEGTELERHIEGEPPGGGATRDSGTQPSVGTLFDRIVSSVRENLTPTATAAAESTATATAVSRPQPLVLLVYSKGEHDTLYLEWTGGPTNATKWQYRQRRWNRHTALTWGAWTDIHSSSATTTSYTVTGLMEHMPYDFQVRAVVGTVSGYPSSVFAGVGEGVTAPKGGPGQLDPFQIGEGDGETEWRIHGLNFVITIPDEMRLKAGGGFVASGGDDGVWLHDLATGSALLMTPGGHEAAREIKVPSDSRQQRGTGVGALFDQIVASVEYK